MEVDLLWFQIQVMGRSNKKKQEEPIQEEEPELIDDDTELEKTNEKSSKKRGICKLILRFLGSNFGLFIVLVWVKT